mmetsp:Transcript_77208/g.224111  ORF Transcript_77208/g.224111 Transcript_77208/m.224111 type:complete len:146 (-) Transcript_77208:86-523(-)
MQGGGTGHIIGPVTFQRTGHATFAVQHYPCRPAQHPEKPVCPGRSFTSYGQWYEAHLPVMSPRACASYGKSSGFWPYGKAVTSLTSSAKDDALYSLDSRTVRNTVPFKPPRSQERSTIAAPALRRVRSTSALFGGHAEAQLAMRR